MHPRMKMLDQGTILYTMTNEELHQVLTYYGGICVEEPWTAGLLSFMRDVAMAGGVRSQPGMQGEDAFPDGLFLSYEDDWIYNLDPMPGLIPLGWRIDRVLAPEYAGQVAALAGVHE